MEHSGELNIELAKKLNESAGHHSAGHTRFEKGAELVEALVLALVAVATAWTGYQAAKWDGVQTERYSEAAQLNTKAEGLMVLAGQDRIYDTVTFNAWLNSKLNGNDRAASLLERRFRDEYRTAFGFWMNMDPFNREAPAGPIFLPQYRNANTERAAKLGEDAAALFSRGSNARNVADRYIRVTVFFATVLLLIAIGQRFRVKALRIGLSFLATALLLMGLVNMFTLPSM